MEILSVKVRSNISSDVSEGTCVDSGAQLLVFGQFLADSYCITYSRKRETTSLNTSCLLGNKYYNSIGLLRIWIAVTEQYFIDVFSVIVDADV